MKNRKALMMLVTLVTFMFCMAYISVPIYSLFCKVTGFGGSVKRIESNYDSIVYGTSNILVNFNSDISPDLPWRFKPEQPSISVLTGETGLAFYVAENKTDKPIEGIAIYNVTPHKAAKYFNKVACFCFTKQMLKPYEKVYMPVAFFIDPEIETDPSTKEVKNITLSYTFFPYKEGVELQQ